MRTPLTVTRAGAVKELAAALRREKRSVNQIRIRAVLSVVRGNHVPMVARWMSLAERAVRNWVHRYNHRGLVGLQDQRKGRLPTAFTQITTPCTKRGSMPGIDSPMTRNWSVQYAILHGQNRQI